MPFPRRYEWTLVPMKTSIHSKHLVLSHRLSCQFASAFQPCAPACYSCPRHHSHTQTLTHGEKPCHLRLSTEAHFACGRPAFYQGSWEIRQS